LTAAVAQVVEELLQVGKALDSSSDEAIKFFSLYNPSNRTMALGFIRPRTEMNTRKISEGKGWVARETDNIFAIYNHIFYAK
jgi:hypothetical protein